MFVLRAEHSPPSKLTSLVTSLRKTILNRFSRSTTDELRRNMRFVQLPFSSKKDLQRGHKKEVDGKCTWKTEQSQKRYSNLRTAKSSSSPRSISIVQLNTLLCLHPRPINLVVYEWPYSFEMMGYLILRCTSRLDAFSVYYIRTRLFSYALGRTTDAPEVRPTRSSRTKVSSSQISNAHDR